MNAIKVWADFLHENEYNETFVKMATAVMEQLGGVDEDMLDTLDSLNNGSDGYTGFIWYTDTCEFYHKNADIINASMSEQSEEFGLGLIEMIKDFGGVQGNYSYDEIGKAIYGSYGYEQYDTNMYLYDIFAKYALEEVAYRFQDFYYNYDEDDDNGD